MAKIHGRNVYRRADAEVAMVQEICKFVDSIHQDAHSEITEDFKRHTEAYSVSVERQMLTPPTGAVSNLGVQCATKPWHQMQGADHLLPLPWLPYHLIPPRTPIPKLVRVGDLLVTFERSTLDGKGLGVYESLSIPALLPVWERGLIYTCKGHFRDPANQALQALLLRMIACTSPGMVRVLQIDPVGVGNSFTFLQGLPEAIRGPMAWHEPRQIAEQLELATEAMGVTIQQRLGDASSIEEYNRRPNVVPEPYRIVAVANFPCGFDDRMCRQLQKLLENGPRAGVLVFMTFDLGTPLPHGIDAGELLRFAQVLDLACKDACDTPFFWIRLPGRPNYVPNRAFGDSTVHIDYYPPPSEVVEAISTAMQGTQREIDQVQVPLSICVPEDINTWWTGDIADGIVVPIGLSGGTPIHFALGGPNSTHHAFIGGATGKGKSVLLHVVIMAICARYSPDDVQLYLLDFKSGVEFQAYKSLAHAKVVAIEGEPELGLSVLIALAQELRIRGEKFRSTGANNIGEYRRVRPDDRMPTILLLVDEYQVMFQRKGSFSAECSQLLHTLVSQGRSQGIHVVLSSQTLSDLESATRDQLQTRIALFMSEKESFNVLSNNNGAANSLTRPGEAIYNSQLGAVGANRTLQVAYADKNAADQFVKAVNELVVTRRLQGRIPLIRDGSLDAHIQANQALIAPQNGRRKYVDLFIGEPVALREGDFAITLMEQSRQNVLVVGNDEGHSVRILFAMLLSLAVQVPPNTFRIRVLNLTNVNSDFHDHFSLLESLPQKVQIGGRRDIVQFIEEAHSECVRRDTEGNWSSGEILVIFGAQRARDLQREGHRDQPATSKLKEILVKGPDLACHVVLAVDNLDSLSRILEKKDRSEFSWRIATQGSDIAETVARREMQYNIKDKYALVAWLDEPGAPEKVKTYSASIFQHYHERFEQGTKS